MPVARLKDLKVPKDLKDFRDLSPPTSKPYNLKTSPLITFIKYESHLLRASRLVASRQKD